MCIRDSHNKGQYYARRLYGTVRGECDENHRRGNQMKKDVHEMTQSTKKLTMGSLFDGIGGFPLASVRCGIEPIWASEIEPFLSLIHI